MTKTYTQADVAVAAALEKAAEKLKSMCDNIKQHEKNNHFWTNGSENGQAYNSGLYSALNFLDVDEILDLIQTDALAEHDAKVRADALRDFQVILSADHTHWAEVEALETLNNRKANANQAQARMNTISTLTSKLQALIEGEA